MAVQAGWGIHTEELAGKEYKYRFVAACDIIPERVEKMKERYGCKGYDNIGDLIADPDVEIVDIATRGAMVCGKTGNEFDFHK